MSDRELMQQALVANEQALAYFDEVTYLREQTAPMRNKLLFSSQALRARLAEPDDEPYCWAVSGCSTRYTGPHAEDCARDEAKRIGRGCKAFPLYTRPAARAVLTHEQINAMAREAQIRFCLKSGGSFEEEFARSIERAHGITGDSHD